jgi:hypothetical protein
MVLKEDGGDQLDDHVSSEVIVYRAKQKKEYPASNKKEEV